MRMPESKCPYCEYPVDGATSATRGDDVMPKVGDYSICIECAALSIFGEGLQLRKMTTEERRLAQRNKGVMAATLHAKAFLRARNAPNN